MKVLRILVLIFASSVFVNAQKTILSGIVLDEKDAVIPNLLVEFKSENGEKFSVVSDEDGKYQIKLPLGD